MKSSSLSLTMAFMACTCFWPHCIKAQESAPGKAFLKIYSNLGYEKYSDPNFRGQTGELYELKRQSNFDLLRFSPAITFMNDRGNYHELELSSIQFGRNDLEISKRDSLGNTFSVADGYAISNFEVSLRYEYVWALNLFSEGSRFRSSVGISGSPMVAVTTLDPKATNEFPISRTNVGLRVAVVPRINYSLSERWFLDVNAPITIGNVTYNFDKIENPSLPVEERRSSGSQASSFPSIFLLRLGIGVKI